MEILIDEYSWQEFKVALMDELYPDGFEKSRFIFRGQSNSDWELKSSFDRLFNNVHVANEILNEFKQDCEKYDFYNSIILNDSMSIMALGQHFGLPTKLLDWSFSPYIAAFFAFSDINLNNYNCEHVAIWSIYLQDEIFNQELGLEIINIKQVGNHRLRNQDGLFTYLKASDRDLEQFIKKLTYKRDTPVLRKILIRKSEMAIALNDLDAMGINNLRIYPDLSGIALNAKLKYYLKNTHNILYK